MLTNQFRLAASRMYAALLAADRDIEADAVARTLLRYDDIPTSRLSLVASALKAGQIERRREQHLKWLHEASSP